MYVKVLKKSFEIMIVSSLYYKKNKSDIESIGFKVDPYDICVVKRIVNGR